MGDLDGFFAVRGHGAVKIRSAKHDDASRRRRDHLVLVLLEHAKIVCQGRRKTVQGFVEPVAQAAGPGRLLALVLVCRFDPAALALCFLDALGQLRGFEWRPLLRRFEAWRLRLRSFELRVAASGASGCGGGASSGALAASGFSPRLGFGGSTARRPRRGHAAAPAQRRLGWRPRGFGCGASRGAASGCGSAGLRRRPRGFRRCRRFRRFERLLGLQKFELRARLRGFERRPGLRRLAQHLRPLKRRLGRLAEALSGSGQRSRRWDCVPAAGENLRRYSSSAFALRRLPIASARDGFCRRILRAISALSFDWPSRLLSRMSRARACHCWFIKSSNIASPTWKIVL